MRSGALPTLLDRAADPAGFERWHEQARATGFCSHPVRLRGSTATVDGQTGELLASYATANEPDGTLLVACRNRRATRCPSCADTYRQDSFHLIAAGLRGGKTVPAAVASHPRVFLTLTAPSFGRSTRSGTTATSATAVAVGTGASTASPAAAGAGIGTATRCWASRSARCASTTTAPCCGTPSPPALAPHHHRHPPAARPLADIRVRKLNDHVRLRFTKVIEYQARGALHLHAVLRLDGPDPDAVTTAAPAWTVELLEEAIRRAVAAGELHRCLAGTPRSRSVPSGAGKST